MALAITLKPGLKSQADLPPSGGTGGPNPFDQFDSAQGGPSNPFDAFDGQPSQGPDESVGGVLSQFGSGAVRGAVSLPGLPADLLTLGFRGAEYLGGTPENERTPQDQLPWAPFGSETFRTMAERNLPLAPKDESGGIGSYAETIGEFASPTALTGAGIVRAATQGVARGTAGRVMQGIAANPVRFGLGEAAAATAGGTGSEAARQADPNNPWLPVVGGLAGSLAPGGIAAGVRGAIRGGQGGARRVSEALSEFEKLGTTPTLSQATSGGYSAGQLFSRVLEFTPGGYLPSRARVAKQINAASARLDQAIASAQPSEVAAGDALRAGAQRFAGKIDRTQAALEARLERAVPSDTIVDPSETLAALDKLYKPAMSGPGSTASAIGAATVSPTARNMLTRLVTDMKDHNGTPFGALKAFRSRLGAKTSSGQSLIADMAAGEAKLLYQAITHDMERAATAHGGGNIVRLRNSYYAARKGQVEQTFDARMPPQGSSEAVYRSVKNSDASQLRQIMRQLSPEQRRVVARQVLQEMGMPPPSGATGDTQRFSFESFDTNFEKLNRKGALDALFRFSGTQDLKSALDDIAAVAERVKGSEKFLRNPSGTAPVGIQVAGMSAVGTKILAADPIGALFMAGMVYGVPFALVKGGNSKAFLKLIADTGRATEATLPGHIARMAEFVRLNPEYAPVMKQIIQHAQEPQQEQQQPNQAAWTGSGGPEIGRPNVPADYDIESQPNYDPAVRGSKQPGIYDSNDLNTNVQGQPMQMGDPNGARRAVEDQSAQAIAELESGKPGFGSPRDINSTMSWASRGGGERSEVIDQGPRLNDILKSMEADYAQLREGFRGKRGFSPTEARTQEQFARRQFAQRALEMLEGNRMMSEQERARVEEDLREHQRQVGERREMVATLLAELMRRGRPRAKDVQPTSGPRNF